MIRFALCFSMFTAGVAPLAMADVRAPSESPRPHMRPAAYFAVPPETPAKLRPKARPDTVLAMGKRSSGTAGKAGGICATSDIQGEVVGVVPGRIKGCGVKNAVRVRSVSGVALSQGAVMDCTTAKALNTWVKKGVLPAYRNIATLRVAAHYACRTRNNRPGAKISEHGKGHAIDISGFTMKDGRVVTLLGHWGRGADGRKLAQMHRAACGPFGTVLGPNSDRYHKDHFHFDTARYRGGPYCR